MTDIDTEALRARYEGHYHKTASADVLSLLTELAAARAELAILRRLEGAMRRLSNSFRPDCSPFEWEQFKRSESVQDVDNELLALRAASEGGTE